MLLCCNVDLYAGERQIALCLLRGGERTQRVLFLLGLQCIEGVAQEHIGVQRIILGLHRFLTEAVIYGQVYLCLLWE